MTFSCRSIVRPFIVSLTLVLAVTLIGVAQSSFKIDTETVRNSIVFLHYVDDRGVATESGTGFLLGIPDKTDSRKGWIVLVTARHIVDPKWAGCAAPTGELKAVFNKKDYDPSRDATGVVEASLGNWIYPDDQSVDIAFQLLDALNYLPSMR